MKNFCQTYFQKYKKRLRSGLLFVAVLFALTVHGFMLKEVNYTIDAPTVTKVTKPHSQNLNAKTAFKIALLTDLHGCYYGKNQQDLVSRLKKQSPNAILLGGDIYDDRQGFANTDSLLSQLSAIAPTYYVDGNHEWWLSTENRLESLKRIAHYGIKPIMGKQVAIPNTRIVLFGLSDPESREFDNQFQQLNGQVKTENFNILLSHRPERIDEYRQYPFDLVLSGHAHGGQWRIPFIMNGLFAPSQGFLPKYAGGLYEFNGAFAGQTKTTHFIVSRGLARETTKVPRFFNNPELVFITVNF